MACTTIEVEFKFIGMICAPAGMLVSCYATRIACSGPKGEWQVETIVVPYDPPPPGDGTCVDDELPLAA